MNTAMVDRIVAATLYEGYILYPYRASSVKNQVRWTFGGVFPRAHSEAVHGADPHTATTECLLRGGHDARLEVRVRFLHVVARTAARLSHPLAHPPASHDPPPELERVATVDVDGVTHRSWEEAAERELDGGRVTLGALLTEPRMLSLSIPAGCDTQWLRTPGGTVTAALLREHEPLLVSIEVSAERVATDLARVRVAIGNVSPVSSAQITDRSAALRHALVSTHVMLGVEEGAWLSLADPPVDAAAPAAACRNTGLWPALIGEPGSADTILASPIILQDHPQLAPESPGDLFDATEIDEILSLRILTLTDTEKEEMRSADDRARAMLERTENLTQDDFMRMHGALRSTRPRIGGPDE
ncbi:MAG TPA: hypothetical protein VG520_08950 [Candidatus Dormibacteraeota bacterium]|jgi:hypothetical protein|nr:hypothetical protein [Candidatus Dormibacteraeota bacterium]